jgi:glycosyltransferase involved in cell wall biosynthesis
MRKLKIIHIQVLPILSGVQNAMLDIITRLDANRYDITVLCQSEGDLTEVLREQSIKYILLPELRREINPFFDAIAFWKLYKLFKKQKYDIVHTHSSKPGIIGRLAAKAAGVKVIVHTVQGFAFHEYSSKLSINLIGLLERIAGWVSSRVIFVNHKDRMVAQQLRILPNKKMITIPNGIDLARFENSRNGNHIGEITHLLGTPVSGALIGMVARLWEQKAPQYFVQAIPPVVKEFPHAKFLLIGDGPLQPELEKLAEKLGVRDSVLFLGWRSDVEHLLTILDIFVLTSLWEGLPVSILEAMAASKPVVATNIKGNNELVVHGTTGYLVEPRNANQIAHCIVNLLREPMRAKEMGRLGKLRAMKYFEINNVVERVDALYSTYVEF